MKNYNSPKIRKLHLRWGIALWPLILILWLADFGNAMNIFLVFWIPLLTVVSFSNTSLYDAWSTDLQNEIEELKKEIDKIKISNS